MVHCSLKVLTSLLLLDIGARGCVLPKRGLRSRLHRVSQPGMESASEIELAADVLQLATSQTLRHNLPGPFPAPLDDRVSRPFPLPEGGPKPR
jgi:hypothetical protein